MSNNKTAPKVADYLLQIKAIKLQPANPFQWASGWLSPLYLNNRKFLSYPNIRNFIRDVLSEGGKSEFVNAEIISRAVTGDIHCTLPAKREWNMHPDTWRKDQSPN